MPHLILVVLFSSLCVAIAANFQGVVLSTSEGYKLVLSDRQELDHTKDDLDCPKSGDSCRDPDAAG